MDKFAQVQTLFEQAVALPQGARTAFVQEQSGDPTTCKKVLALLHADRNADDVLARLAGDLSPLMDLHDAPEIPGYRIEGMLGEGGMGVVYAARDTTLQRKIAIKVLPRVSAVKAQQKQRFLREARAMAALNHRNVGEIFELGETADGQPFIASAFCEGRNLSELFAQNDLTLDAILIVLIQLCDALAAAHNKNIYHRDIKPANIIVDNDWNLKLVDFGIAKMEGEDLSQTGQLLGTFNYMAPEQFSGVPVDARTDLWAVGILLYEALSGVPPFQADNAAEIMYQLFNRAVPQVQSLPEQAGFNDILRATLCQNRSHRIASADKLGAKLRQLRGQLEQSGQLSFVPGKQQRAALSAHNTLTEIRHVIALGMQPVNNECVSLLRKYPCDINSCSDALLQASFGYPQISEAAADIALKAALELLQLNPEAQLVLQVVPMVFANQSQHTGITRHGDIGGALQNLWYHAKPGKIILTTAVNKRLRKPFTSTDAAIFSLSVNDFARNTERTYDTPFCGRLAELAVLRASWQGVCEGQGRAILLSGDAGMGKTRLLAEFQQQSQPHYIHFQTDPSGSDTAFHPLINGLKDFLRDSYGSTQLDPLLYDLKLQHGDNPALLQWLMGQNPSPSTLAGYSPQALRTACFDAIDALLRQLCARQALLLVFEDLHWADSSSLEWLQKFLQQPLKVPLLLVLTGRPSLFERWQLVPSLLHLPLASLSRQEAHDLARQLSPQQQDLEQLCETTAGNPLFIEEYSRMLRQGDTTSVPESLEEVLLSRVDQLGDAKRVAQTAAIMGRHFYEDELAQLEASGKIQPQLQQLQTHQLIFLRGDGRFNFSHALIRDALYASLNSDERRALHHRYALQIAKTATPKNFEEVAFHFAAADESAASLAWWIAAAESARDRYALRETLRLCDHGLANLEKGEALAAHKKWRLALLLIQGPALIALNNYANSEVGHCYKHAVALCENSNDLANLFTARMGLWSHLCVRARHPEATLLAQQLLDYATAQNNADLLIEAHLASGMSALFMARFDEADKHLATAISLYEPSMAAQHIATYGQDPGMASYTFRALLEEARGKGAEAIANSNLAVATGRASQHPFSLGFALAFAVHIHLRQQAVPQAMALRAEYQQLSKKQELHVFALLGAVQESLMLIGGGQLQQGVQALEQAIPPYRAFGTEIFLPSWYALLALSYAQLNNLAAARENLQRAQQQLDNSSEFLSQPYLHMAQQAIANSTPGG
ncbi:AAA ATPase-like protein [Alteromonadaceae bacterium 2753L.S.0a.02]|nr:AAA ATPase-like protein [Alteromonadaceae bacterium 2753L.S.0a.02]